MKFYRQYRKKILALALAIIISLTPLPKIAKADSLLKFDEGNGATVSDANGNISGTITNAVWKTGEMCFDGKCLYFDGTGDLINFGDDADLDFAGAANFTLEGWFRTPDITSGQRTIIAKYNEATGTDGGYKVYIDSNGYLTFGIDNDQTGFPSDSVSTSATAFDDNQWHHFAAVKTGTTSITLYVDGNQYATDSTITASTLANTDTFYIGIDGDGSSNGFSGFLDEIKILNSARTAAEIKTDSLEATPDRGVSVSFGPDDSYLSNGLVGYWKMDETSGNPVDSSGNGLTLTNNATTTFVGGKFGKGSEYVPASSQYLSTATTISGVKSVSFWTNPDATTNYFVSLTSGAYITANAGTISATGFTNPQIYVNGTASTTLTQDLWQLVTVTSATAIDANQFYIGRQDVNYYDGTIDEVRIYNRVLSPAEVNQLYNFAPGPIGYWKLDENTGQSAFDTAGNGNTGTFGSSGSPDSADPIWTTGKYGSGVKTGVDDYVNVPDNDNYSVVTTGAFTVETWIKIDSESGGQEIISKSGWGSSPGNYEWHLARQNGGSIKAETSGLDGTIYLVNNTATTVPLNQWAHIAFTIDTNIATPILMIYINGVLAATDTTQSGGILANGTLPVRFGMNADGTYPTYGSIDDVRIYNYARTPGQIIEDMNGGHPAPGSPVGSAVAHWKFDEGYGTTAYDGSINTNNLTLSSASWTNSGKFGKAYHGGNNLRATRADDADFDFVNGTDDFTLSLWFNRGGAISNQEYLLDKHTTNDGFTMYMDSDGDIVCGIGDGASFPEDTAGTTAANYDDTNWHQAVCVKQGTSSLTLYIDGKSVASDTSLGAIANMSNTGKLILGDTNETDGTDEWLGDIDEVKIFRSALTANQVKVLYNQSSQTVMGALSTDSSGNASNADTDSYCPPGQSTACTPPVGHWKLDENTGQSAFDTSGNGNTGTFGSSGSPDSADPIWTTGKYGSGVKTGVDDYVNVPDNDNYSVVTTGAFTVETWINIDIESGGMEIISKDGSSNYEWHLARQNGGAIKAEVSGLDGTIYINNNTPTTVPLGQWAHIAFTIDTNIATPILMIYINGVLASTNTTQQGGILANGTLPVHFGMNDSGTYPTYGSIDDVRIYNYARTPAQIAWDYNHGGPVGWWKLDENTGTAANDSSGFSHTGTLTNTPTWTTGKFNTAVSFAGSNQHIIRADDSDFDFADDADMTLMTWFKHTTASAQEIIMSKYAAAGYKIIMESDGDITCGLDYDSTWTPTDSVTSTAATYDDGNWHHIACVKTGAASLSLYIDGILIGSDSSLTATNTLTNADPLYLGIDADAASNDFTGSLDDVRIYRYPLTPQQIKTVINQGALRFSP